MTELRTATASNQATSLTSKTFLLLTLSMAIASGGAYVGFGLNNPALVIACVVANLVGLFILWAVRENTALSLAVLTGWMAISGITVGVMVQKLNVDGSLDNLFGIGGTGFYELTPNPEFANSVALDNSGNLLVGGVLQNTNESAIEKKYNNIDIADIYDTFTNCLYYEVNIPL